MKKHKENIFSSKFRLLNSQEYSEEIIWSSSDSSEFEDVDTKTNFSNITNKKRNGKRKRKVKLSNNVSNLDITIIDVTKDTQGEKSPVLTSKKCKSIENILDKTYSIPRSAEYNFIKTDMTSPVLCTGTQRANYSIKSPVIAQKFASPINSPKVKKMLFSKNENPGKVQVRQRRISPVLSHYFTRDRRKTEEDCNIKVEDSTPILEKNTIQNKHNSDSNNSSSQNSSNVDLIKKVKSFFDNQFSSENCSQVSIADTPTPQNSLNNDVEIISITQMTSNESSVRTIKHTNSTDNSTIEAEKSKKMRYKKDGLAYRLCSLLKKHNASISLWQHEKFLAENSNFKIPKGEHMVFQIQKVDFKYGSYLLDAVDASDEKFLILINNYVNSCVFSVNSIFKLYEPYQLLNCDQKQLIVNVCKFECVTLDM